VNTPQADAPTATDLSFLRDVRRSLDVKQAAVAKLAGISTSFYGEIERGDKTCSPEVSARILDAISALVNPPGSSSAETSDTDRHV
jgi:transcriptional regulator with XRE-family HTH domain